MFTRKQLVGCLAVIGLGVSAVLACGPNFPWQLLDDRTQTLKATPTNSFAFEVERLAPPPSDHLRVVEYQDRKIGEMEGLSAAHADSIRRMREAATGDAAFAIEAEVPLAVRSYTAGAVAFHKENAGRALVWFQSILALPEEEQRLRATWASFMIGRCYGRLGDVEKASEAFRRTRELALAGAPDPLGLAVASYGEEAKLHLDRAQNLITESELSTGQTTEYARAITTAVLLYAEQAARKSTSGVQSLRVVAERLLFKTPERLAAVVADPIVQRLLVAYVLARDDNFSLEIYEPDGETLKAELPLRPLLVPLVEAIEQRGLAHVTGADRLAALAYRIGRYDLAERLTVTASGPLSAWVRAKLALQKGDLTTAATFYAEASKAFPSLLAEDKTHALESENIRRLAGERGVLTLARGEYVEALALLYPVASTYWGDVAYLAERVLTVDELQHFVDAKVPPPRVVSLEQKTDENTMSEDEDSWLSQPHPATRLRDLLARRLVRVGRYQEALAYFHAPDDPSFTEPYIRTHAAAYAQALQEAERGWWPIERAEAWRKAAVMARKFGMEMMGTEAAPDFFAIGGSLDSGIGHTPSEGPFVTEGELHRFGASAANPDLRFHYRYRAVEHNLRAADLLPPRSQAFAAVLCQASGWMLDRDDQRARELYHRYVQSGPAVPWATHFGRNCPEPDFKAAARMAKRQPFHDAGQFARRYRWLISGGLVVGIGAILVLRARQMRQT